MMLQQGLRQLATSYSLRPPSALAEKFNSVEVMTSARSDQTAFFDDLNYPNNKQYLAFPSYTCMSNFAEQNDCRTVLEIGAGLSTAVWARFAEQSGAKICTVDADLSRMRSYVKGTQHDERVSKFVELIEGVSINTGEFTDFYLGEPQTSFGGVDVAVLRNHIDEFQSNNCSLKRRNKVRGIAGHRGWRARDLMTTESSLVLPRQLLNVFSSKRNFDNEIEFLEKAESRGVAGLIPRLTQMETAWDLIFFDSGELASMIEWPLLKNNIAIGGFAAFHDIFFPKSIKNIIPCAAIMADPDWEIAFCDDSTRQGLLIAKRLR